MSDSCGANNCEFLTMSEYLDIAEKMLLKFNRGIGINDEDAISFVATYMMQADQNFDQSKCGEAGNRYGYRAACGKYAIMHWRTKYRKMKSKKTISISAIETTKLMADNSLLSVADQMLYDEILEVAQDALDERQFIFFKQYYVDGRNMTDIGKDFGLTKAAVSLSIIKSRNKIKKHMGVNV